MNRLNPNDSRKTKSDKFYPLIKFSRKIISNKVEQTVYLNHCPKKPWKQGLTHHYFCFAAVSSAVVVGGDDLKLEVGPPHVAVHDGCFHYTTVRLDDEAVLAVFSLFADWRRWDDEPVCHGAVVTSVLVDGLQRSKNKKRSIEMVSIIKSSHNNQVCAWCCNQITAAIIALMIALIQHNLHPHHLHTNPLPHIWLQCLSIYSSVSIAEDDELF